MNQILARSGRCARWLALGLCYVVGVSSCGGKSRAPDGQAAGSAGTEPASGGSPNGAAGAGAAAGTTPSAGAAAGTPESTGGVAGAWLGAGGAGGSQDTDLPGFAGAFSEGTLIGSCRFEDCAGCARTCREHYEPDPHSELDCGHLVANPELYEWSADPCPRSQVIAVCVREQHSVVYYYYEHDDVHVASLQEVCDAVEGRFVVP